MRAWARAAVLACWLLAGALAFSIGQEGRGHITNEDTTSKIELEGIEIECVISDILIFTAPVVNAEYVLYYLTRPDGAIAKLNISRPSRRPRSSFMRVQFLGENIQVITPVQKYTKFNVNMVALYPQNVLGLKIKSMTENDIIMGPLQIHDHGNWVLSLYFNKDNGEAVELFQVITIIVSEEVPAYPSRSRQREGTDVELRFAYSLPDVETCELQAPSSAVDRFYARTDFDKNHCGYVLKNVTRDDSGRWKIVAVGRIVYTATVILKIVPWPTKQAVNLLPKQRPADLRLIV